MPTHTTGSATPRRRTLLGQFTGLVLLAVFLPVLVLAGVLLWQSSVSVRAQGASRLAATANASARELESFLRVHTAAMQVLADRRSDEGNLDDLARWESDLARVNRHYPAFAHLLVADADGRVLTSLPSLPRTGDPTRVADREYFLAPRASGQAHVSSVYQGRGPGYAEAHNNLGLVLIQSGKDDEGIASLREAVRIAPDYADGWGYLALMYRHALQGFSKGERENFPRMVDSAAARALALQPDQPDAARPRLDVPDPVAAAQQPAELLDLPGVRQPLAIVLVAPEQVQQQRPGRQRAGPRERPPPRPALSAMYDQPGRNEQADRQQRVGPRQPGQRRHDPRRPPASDRDRCDRSEGERRRERGLEPTLRPDHELRAERQQQRRQQPPRPPQRPQQHTHQ